MNFEYFALGFGLFFFIRALIMREGHLALNIAGLMCALYVWVRLLK